ncbi:lactonase family protein [Opitutaceae bacterium]|nr:lactonase family protein [bacterium]MDB4384874.1 lactonase family protein [Opitutaceae bacterium]
MTILRAFLTLTLSTAPLLSAKADTAILIAGTGGVHRTTIDLESGKLSSPELVHEFDSGSWLVWHPTLPVVYSSWQEGKTGGLKALEVSASGDVSELVSISLPFSSPTHIAVSPTAEFLSTVHYGSGATTLISLGTNGVFEDFKDSFQHRGNGPHPNQTKSRPHWVGFTEAGDKLHVTDLGSDDIWTFAVNREESQLKLLHKTGFPAGSGPRHMAFTADRKFAYVSDELSHHVSAFEYDAAEGTFSSIQHIDAAPADLEELTNNVSEILVHPSGDFVYTANRGHDSVAVFSRDHTTGKLTLVENEPARGVWPRNFTITADGAWLIAASQISGTIASFSIDQTSGKLTYARSIIHVPAPIRLLLPKE